MWLDSAMNIEIAYAKGSDLDWLHPRDRHVDLAFLKRKIKDREILLAFNNDVPVGWLRFGYFWDMTPFLNLLYVEEEFRKFGVGTSLVNYWEEEMSKLDHAYVLTSTQSNEDAQHFYLKCGYKEIGSFELPNEPSELIFVKSLS